MRPLVQQELITKHNSLPVNHAQYDAYTQPQLSNAMWFHWSGNSLSVSTQHSHLGKLGSKCRGHSVVQRKLPSPHGDQPES